MKATDMPLEPNGKSVSTYTVQYAATRADAANLHIDLGKAASDAVIPVLLMGLAGVFVLAVILKWRPFNASGRPLRAFYIALGLACIAGLNSRHLPIEEAVYVGVGNFIGWFVISGAILWASHLVHRWQRPNETVHRTSLGVGKQPISEYTRKELDEVAPFVISVGKAPEKVAPFILRKATDEVSASVIRKRKATDELAASVIRKRKATDATSSSIIEPTDTFDAELWEQALTELEQHTYHRGLWAKCFAQANGDGNVAQANYLKQRVLTLSADESRKIAEITATSRFPTNCPSCRGLITMQTETCTHCNAWLGVGSDNKPVPISIGKSESQHSTQEPADYLENLIHVEHYMRKYKTTQAKLEPAILKGKIKAQLIDGGLWVEDRRI